MPYFLNFLYLAGSNPELRCKSAMFFDTKSIRIDLSINKFKASCVGRNLIATNDKKRRIEEKIEL
jgi:hypothetical protein